MNRKGVTPVVATVMLIAISMAAVASSAVFLSDIGGDIRSNIEEQLGVQQKEEKAELSIVQGFNSSSNGNIFIVVKNEGEITLTFKENGDKKWNLFVDSRPATGWGIPGSSNPDVLVNPQETVTIDTGSSFPSNVGDSKTVEIRGQYKTSSAIVCDKDSAGDTAC
ncbi:MAG: hypothetical protein ABEJ69_01760 [Candidatus Nanohaloarchaea archaeon]